MQGPKGLSKLAQNMKIILNRYLHIYAMHSREIFEQSLNAESWLLKLRYN